ncbi:MAG: GAF domain-containing protein [Geobacteraceae bacterium]|nr:GAF domain-containing protein [Geobacteraceae bacterium]
MRTVNSANLSYAARFVSLARLIRKTLLLESATIYILDTERRMLSRKVCSSGPARLLICAVPAGEGAAGRCASSRQPLSCGREHLHRDETTAGPESTITCLPICHGSQLMGALSLESPAGSPLPSWGVTVLHDILTEVAGLISTMEITERSNRRIQHLMTLNELGMALVRPVPYPDLPAAISRMCHGFGDACCSVLRITPDGSLEEQIIIQCGRHSRPQRLSLLEIEERCSQRVLSTGTPYLAIDVVAEEELPPSCICVPLRGEKRLIGTLTIFGKSGRLGVRRNFDEEDREFFEGMANLAATALVAGENNYRLSLLAAENDRKLKELSLLYRVSNAMHSTTMINRLIHLNLAALVSGSPHLFERAMLFLANRRSGFMQGMLGVTFDQAAPLPEPQHEKDETLFNRWDISQPDMRRQESSDFNRMVMSTRIPLDRTMNIPSRAVLDKRLMLVSGKTKRKSRGMDFINRFQLSSFAAVPLMSKHDAIGVVIVDNPLTCKVISEDDLRLLQLFANQAGMAMDNSILYNRVENANREAVEIRERLLEGERLATLGETAAIVAHELKSPLVSMGGLARRLTRKEPQGSREWHYARTISLEAERLEKMITEILFFSRRTTICYTTCSAQAIIEDSLAVLSGSLEEKNVRVKRRLATAVPDFLGDFQQMKQVFINLFTNAAEAMKNGGTLSVSAAEARLDGTRAVSLKVRDTGGGIPQEILSQIFDPFFTTKEQGTGLGLPIVHRIITNHGGRIQAINHPGVGAEIRILLPVEPRLARD